MKKLYISDLDGTLLNSDAKLSDYSKSTINEFLAKGGHFTISTARTAATVGHILDGVNITLPVILMNGVCTYDLEKKEYINVNFIEKEAVDSLFDIIKKYNLSGFVYTIDNGKLATYYENLESPGAKEFVDQRVKRYNKPFTKVTNFNEISCKGVIYYSISDTKEKLTNAMEEVSKITGLNYSFYRDIYEENCYFLEVSSSKASKYNSLVWLKEKYCFDYITSFGDNLNDIGLFNASDFKVAVSNAREELKASASMIISSNNENGVAEYLKTI